jgi:hypothetical protein
MQTLTPDSFTIEVDPQTGFRTIGQGSLGGKAQGLGLVYGLLNSDSGLKERYPQVKISTPDTLVLGSHGFEAFLDDNDLGRLAHSDLPDDEVAAEFLKGRLPEKLEAALRDVLQNSHHPLAVRSSGMLEDLRYHAYAGLYRTYMLSNDQPELQQRLDRLIGAVKLVWASTFFEGPRAYAKRVGHKLDACAMAVIIQPVAGSRHGRFYYPAISGVAQSCNYYPLGGLKAEDGLATIAMGLGKQVVSGERALRFCPKYPRRLLQRSTVEEVLDYAQRGFYALDLGSQASWHVERRDDLVRRLVSDALEEKPVQLLAGTYVQAEHRVRDTFQASGQRVLTFANVLKYDLFPLAPIIRDMLTMGEKALGAVEIEFAVDLAADQSHKHQFHLLQMRPMTSRQEGLQVTITAKEQSRALCYSQNAMGNIERQDIGDIVFIKPDAFDPGRTRDMVRRVGEINAALERGQRQYLLVGPGRWGSSDPWLGIPVRWADISNVAAIVETTVDNLKAELSQGAHFFHNMTSLGISYFSVSQYAPDVMNWSWLTAQPRAMENEFAAHVRLTKPLALKVDGRTSRGVILVEF